MSTYFDLYDYRRQTTAMYVERRNALQTGENAEMVWQRFRLRRDTLFREHPQSALDEEQRRTFHNLAYFPYQPAFCVPARIETEPEPESRFGTMDAHQQMSMSMVARLHFNICGQAATLSLYWLNIYGGGLFLPFRDATCPAESYGGGRYLFDTIKGSDFLPVPGAASHRSLLLDFNYAYNPSCAYNDRWVCPLAPAENHLSMAIRAGEKIFHA
ncbi:MAG TPA: DUF1684 domain-containing protein [Ktedonobacteraceae bacterium]|nr:DUF1684 domain-containing protein [Ktedonobacteraceae bacterium]